VKHKVVSHEEWTQVRKTLLVREKDFARQREALARDLRELPWEALNVLARENGAIFHTYSTYARGIDPVNGVYQFLDLVLRGRNEDPADTQSWVRRHDEY
jgi:predicted dithiol-disulfide oxidoreductase (DUF899 family)